MSVEKKYVVVVDRTTHQPLTIGGEKEGEKLIIPIFTTIALAMVCVTTLAKTRPELKTRTGPVLQTITELREKLSGSNIGEYAIDPEISSGIGGLVISQPLFP